MRIKAISHLLFCSITLATLVAFGDADQTTQKSYQEQLLEELILATPGTVIEIPEGFYEFDIQLSLTVDSVTVKGQGMGKTILSFKNQVQGAEGFIVNANNVILEDFSVYDTKGDAIKVIRADGVVLRNLEAKWTRGPHSENGGYGLYPVQSMNVLIEGCKVSGASDSGIYVGQSRHVIVRRNIAELNVAGIEAENSQDVDIYHNYVTKNSGGILVFNMPDLSIQGARTRVFGNTIVANNITNFSPPSNTVADVPAGTGIMVTANKVVEIFDNLLFDNQTTNILLVSYVITGRPIGDKTYDPFAESIYVYENTMLDGGTNPQGGSSETTQELIDLLKEIAGLPLPDVLYDGSINKNHTDDKGKTLPEYRVCVQNNHKISFLHLDLTHELAGMTRDLSVVDCAHPKLPKVEVRVPGGV